MADAGAWRHDAKIAQRRLAPLEEFVALAVALKFEIGVEQQGRFSAVLVHLHRVVDDEIDLLKRVDSGRVATEPDHGIAHGGKIDDTWDAGEILEQHTRSAKRDFLVDRRLHIPMRK